VQPSLRASSEERENRFRPSKSPHHSPPVHAPTCSQKTEKALVVPATAMRRDAPPIPSHPPCSCLFFMQNSFPFRRVMCSCDVMFAATYWLGPFFSGTTEEGGSDRCRLHRRGACWGVQGVGYGHDAPGPTGYAPSLLRLSFGGYTGVGDG